MGAQKTKEKLTGLQLKLTDELKRLSAVRVSEGLAEEGTLSTGSVRSDAKKTAKKKGGKK